MRALFDLYDREIVWDMSRSNVPDMGLYLGHEGVRQFMRDWALENFDDYYAHAEQFMDAGDRVVVEVRQGGRGKGSGVHVEMPRYWQVYSVQVGKIVRVEVYRDKAEALAGS